MGRLVPEVRDHLDGEWRCASCGHFGTPRVTLLAWLCMSCGRVLAYRGQVVRAAGR